MVGTAGFGALGYRNGSNLNVRLNRKNIETNGMLPKRTYLATSLDHRDVYVGL